MSTDTPTRPSVAPPSEGDAVTRVFASPSVTEHVLRGVLGLVLVVVAVAYAGSTPWALLLAIPAVVAWRGCPTCWALGLAATLSRGRAGCDDNSCRTD